MNIEFKWIGGGNWMITADSIKIICDPVLCKVDSVHDYRYFKSKRISPPLFSPSDFQNVNIWLFTHGHKDHCDFNHLQPIQSESTVITDRSAMKRLSTLGITGTRLLSWGNSTLLDFPNDIKIMITAVPAIHGLNFCKGALVGNGNGYWITITKAEKSFIIFASGDTLPNRYTIKSIYNKRCDLFIANTGNATVGKGLLSKLIGRITMNVADIVRMQQHFSPEIIVPIHWDAFEHYREQDIRDLCIQNSFRYLQQGTTIRLHK